MQGRYNPANLQAKVQAIKSGTTMKTDLGTKQNKNVIHGKDAKYIVEEREKKFEEAGVKRKKRNYVLYESKLGTEKEQNLKKIAEPPKPKPKPVPVARPRVEEKIIIQKKRKEYLDNYQYHETKVIRNPNPRRVSIVTHQRLGDIIGGFYEEMTYQKQSVRHSAGGQNLYSQQTTKTTSRGGPQTQSQRIVTSSRTVPAQPREYRKEVRSGPKQENRTSRGSKVTTTKTTTTTTSVRSRSRPQEPRGKGTTTTTTTKVVTRGRSAGRKH